VFKSDTLAPDDIVDGEDKNGRLTSLSELTPFSILCRFSTFSALMHTVLPKSSWPFQYHIHIISDFSDTKWWRNWAFLKVKWLGVFGGASTSWIDD
jgi:hypothetical protein